MKFLSFGSVNRDITYRLDHIVREGETLPCGSMEEFWGGKGQNQCIALARAGAETYLAARVGQGDLAPLKDLLQNQYGVDPRYLAGDPAPTGHAIIQVSAAGQNSIIIYPGANHTMDPAFISRVLDGFRPGDVVLLQNEINGVPEILREAKVRGLRVALNPSPFTPELLAWPLELVDLFVLNEVECQGFCGSEDPLALRARYPQAEVVLTLGSRGSVFAGQAGVFRQAIYRVPTVDTTAAGDTFTGYFLRRYYESGDPVSALDLAARASAIAVTRRGAVPSIPRAEEVAAYFSE